MSSSVTQATILLVIAGMAVMNFVLRFTPIAAVSRKTMPEPVLRWMSFVPVSVMGTLVATEVLRPQGNWQPPLTNPGLYAALLSALVFRCTRSFLGATVAGMVCFVGLRTFFA